MLQKKGCELKGESQDGTQDPSNQVKVKVLVTQSCLTLRPHGLQPARFFYPWDSPGKNTGMVPMPSSRLKDWTWVSCIAGKFFIIWATKQVHTFEGSWVPSWLSPLSSHPFFCSISTHSPVQVLSAGSSCVPVGRGTMRGEDTWFGAKQTWVQVLTSAHISCLNLSLLSSIRRSW